MKHPYLLNFLLLILALLLSVAVGAVFIPPGVLVRMLLGQIRGLIAKPDWPEAFQVILFQIRLPHTALIALTGMALGGSGAAYQGLFRNPLADPYLIGVASGAGLGAVIAMAAGEAGLSVGLSLGLFGVPVAAFAGALVTVAIVYFLSHAANADSTTTLILAGVAVGSFTAALTSFFMLRSQGELRRAIAWLFGGATLNGWGPVLAALPYILLGLAFLLTCGYALNVLQFGEEQAAQMGLSVRRARGLIVLAASLTTAAAISFSGIIGFIGLVVPHVARLLWGTDYRRLVPVSILGGASALLLADVLARSVMAPQELPVGIITALVGAPFFFWVLFRYSRKA